MPQAKDVPPLSEIVRMDARNAIMGWAPHLSFAEILMIAARPLHSTPRPDKEIAEFHDVARQRLATLEAERRNILQSIMDKFRISGMQEVAVAEYLEKYRFLVGCSVPRELESRLSEAVLKDIRGLREVIEAYEKSGRAPPNYARKIELYKGTSLNLRYLHRTPYTEQPIQIICIKTKAYWRIAGKIPYLMIDSYRERVPKKMNDIGFRRYMRMEDGRTRDNVGLQFATLDEETQLQLKEFIATSPSIEILANQEGQLFEQYGADVPYSALHIAAAWDPHHKRKQAFNPHADGVEIIIMLHPSFISANFGSDNYWDRMMNQQIGIAKQRFDKYGHRIVDHFTEAELLWKKGIERRILYVLYYGSPQASTYRQ